VCGGWGTGYWYRDDSLALWDAIWTFVEQVLALYYDDDVAVISDIELTAMIAELRQHSITALVRTQALSLSLSLSLYLSLFMTLDNAVASYSQELKEITVRFLKFIHMPSVL